MLTAEIIRPVEVNGELQRTLERASYHEPHSAHAFISSVLRASRLYRVAVEDDSVVIYSQFHRKPLARVFG